MATLSLIHISFQAGFQRTVSRGPDDSRIVDTGKGLLGFHRLSIMGLTSAGMQPFALDGSFVVCNGEIYGFEKLKKRLEEKYTFASDSDCELLLPLYREYEMCIRDRSLGTAKSKDSIYGFSRAVS